MQETFQEYRLEETVATPFNQRVRVKQEKGRTVNIPEAATTLRGIICPNMFQQYGDAHPSDHLNANVEYVLEIALFGFILPGTYPPDEEIKIRLLNFFEDRAIRKASQQPLGLHSIANAFYIWFFKPLLTMFRLQTKSTLTKGSSNNLRGETEVCFLPLFP